MPQVHASANCARNNIDAVRDRLHAMRNASHIESLAHSHGDRQQIAFALRFAAGLARDGHLWPRAQRTDSAHFWPPRRSTIP